VNVTSILDEEASSEEEVEELVKIGVYGLPSAGKSTLMNAMAGRKVTSTSATPGHTKHIQTWYVVRSQNNFL
jgi:ribosome biogenesis GTPase A